MKTVEYNYPAYVTSCLYLANRFYEKFLAEIPPGMTGWKELTGWSFERKVEAMKMNSSVNNQLVSEK